MTLDPLMLERAREEGLRLAGAERQLLVARGEYHAAVRRLHLAGASLREISEALGISHQRVQQMVQSAGGTWWRRAWGSRRKATDAICTWCDRPPSEVAKLVAGPRVFICDRCVGQAARASAGSSSTSQGGWHADAAPRARCAFCARRRSPSRAILSAPAGSICTDCLRATRDLVR